MAHFIASTGNDREPTSRSSAAEIGTLPSADALSLKSAAPRVRMGLVGRRGASCPRPTTTGERASALRQAAVRRRPRLAATRAEPSRVVEFVGRLKRITDAGSIDEVWAVHLDLMAAFGFDRLLYASTRFRTERSIGDLQDMLFLTNHARDYTGPMIERGLVRHAPILGRAEAGARSWAEPARSGEGQQPRLAALALETRLRVGSAAGYDVVFAEVSTRARGALELCARPGVTQAEVDALWKARGSEIELLCGLVHLKICHLPCWGGRRPLTRQQRRVLQWASEGKTAQDIGAIMELTPATVEKHLRLAREALDVQTTAQAVAKAVHWNQLFVDERAFAPQ